MGKIEVKETTVISCREFTGMDGMCWKAAEIAWDGPDYAPGQYVMAARKKKEFPWPSPLMIQVKRRGRLLVYIHQRSPLWEVSAYEPLTLWGPCGKGVVQKGPYIAVSDQAGFLLLDPVVRGLSGCVRQYVIGNRPEREENRLGQAVRFVRGLDELWEEERQKEPEEDTDWLIALPFALASRWKEEAPETIRARTTAFTGVKVGCGIGACRGCYIHGEGQGIPVCQNGPFLPIDTIDYEKDQKFLAHFI